MDELIRHLALSAAGSTAFAGFLGLLERVESPRPDLLRVLTYHRVDEPNLRPHLNPGMISATPAVFEQQIAYLAAHYRVVSALEVLEVIRAGGILPPRAVLVTFDDAYVDFAEQAWPILKRYRVPATLFVPTAFPGSPERAFWWDRIYRIVNRMAEAESLQTPFGRLLLSTATQRHRALIRLNDAIKSLPHEEAMAWVEEICQAGGDDGATSGVLDWDSLRQLSREGVTLAAHTRNHPIMTSLSAQEACAEAVVSLTDLERQVGSVPPIFAYPGGECDETVTQMLRREGFVLAFTTVRGINDLRHADRLRLRRINVGRRTSLPVLRAQLLPWSIHLARWPALAQA